MLKKLGIPVLALAGALGMTAAKPAAAETHFGFYAGPYAAPYYYNPYYLPYYGYPYYWGAGHHYYHHHYYHHR